ADLALVPSAVEEALRYDGPAQAIPRYAVQEAVVGGQRLAAGQRILAWVAAANPHDAAFSEPERLDVARTPKPPLALGARLPLLSGGAAGPSGGWGGAGSPATPPADHRASGARGAGANRQPLPARRHPPAAAVPGPRRRVRRPAGALHAHPGPTDD